MNAQYWRVYYKIQELLANEFLNDYTNGSDGGIRTQSTLPPKLNKTAHEIAKNIVDMHEKKKSYTIVVVTKEVYMSYLNELNTDLRQFVDEDVVTQYYFLAVDINEDVIIGGFTTNSNGWIGGLFALHKGYGNDLLEKQCNIAKANLSQNTRVLKLYCIGDFLREFYEKQGFVVYRISRWDERLAPKKWNGKRFGFPNIYYMKKGI